jgi:hypothetical protein
VHPHLLDASAGRLPPGAVGRATLAKVTRRLLPFVFVLYVVNYLDRINVGFAARS